MTLSSWTSLHRELTIYSTRDMNLGCECRRRNIFLVFFFGWGGREPKNWKEKNTRFQKGKSLKFPLKLNLSLDFFPYSMNLFILKSYNPFITLPQVSSSKEPLLLYWWNQLQFKNGWKNRCGSLNHAICSHYKGRKIWRRPVAAAMEDN